MRVLPSSTKSRDGSSPFLSTVFRNHPMPLQGRALHSPLGRNGYRYTNSLSCHLLQTGQTPCPRRKCCCALSDDATAIGGATPTIRVVGTARDLAGLKEMQKRAIIASYRDDRTAGIEHRRLRARRRRAHRRRKWADGADTRSMRVERTLRVASVLFGEVAAASA